MQNNPDFRFNRMRKSRKTEFFEVHIKRAVITYLITLLFATFSVCREIWTGFIHLKWLHKFKVNGRAILNKGRLNGLIRLVSNKTNWIICQDLELFHIHSVPLCVLWFKKLSWKNVNSIKYFVHNWSEIALFEKL